MSRMIELTPRLRTVADLVPAGARLADVGTDHAYMPTALILEGKIPSGIAADLREGPLSRARMTAAEYGVEDKLSFRLCDGLRAIAPDEVDAVAIAGMGGETIASILEAAPWVSEKKIPLILQPMSSMSDLRLWLSGHGYTVQEERLAKEGDTIYTILLVLEGEEKALSSAELCAGRNSRDPLRGEWLDQWISKTGRALEGLSQSRQESAAARTREMEHLLTGLREMKKEWEVWQR